MNRLHRVLLAGLLALSFAVGAAAQDAGAHNYYGGTYCYYGTLYRAHWHGIYDVAGREVGHSNHGHAIGYCV